MINLYGLHNDYKPENAIDRWNFELKKYIHTQGSVVMKQKIYKMEILKNKANTNVYETPI